MVVALITSDDGEQRCSISVPTREGIIKMVVVGGGGGVGGGSGGSDGVGGGSSSNNMAGVTMTL